MAKGMCPPLGVLFTSTLTAVSEDLAGPRRRGGGDGGQLGGALPRFPGLAASLRTGVQKPLGTSKLYQFGEPEDITVPEG